MTDQPSDDRFAIPRFESERSEPDTATEPDTAAEAQDSGGDTVGEAPPADRVGLTLPPPGLFAVLEEPLAASPSQPPLPPAAISFGGPVQRHAEDADADEPGPARDRDEDPADGESAAGDVAAAPLARVADAVEVIEQLTAQAAAEAQPEAQIESAPEFGDALVLADAAGEPDAADAAEERDAADEPDDERDAAPPAPAEALPEEASPADVFAVRPPPLPTYDDPYTSDERDEEALPQFLLEDSAPLDTVAVQEQLREMAQKPRRAKAEAASKPSLARTLAEIPILLIVAAVIAFLVKTFLAQAYYIPSGSMLPQLGIDDRVVVSKLAYKLHDPRRGDIVVFDDPREGADATDTVDEAGVSKLLRQVGEGVGIVQPSTDEFIKRVVALPGETVEARDGSVYINDRKLIEPYLPEGSETADFPAQTVARGKLWVMGDNRSGSADSRVFGQIEVDSIVGRAIIKVWPFPRISFL